MNDFERLFRPDFEAISEAPAEFIAWLRARIGDRPTFPDRDPSEPPARTMTPSETQATCFRDQHGDIRIARILVPLFLLCTLLFVVLGTLPHRLPIGNPGEFGDSFGFTNAFFSGIALVFASAAIILQTLELREQRRDFRDSLEMQKQQAKTSMASTFVDALSTLARIHDAPNLSRTYGHTAEPTLAHVAALCRQLNPEIYCLYIQTRLTKQLTARSHDFSSLRSRFPAATILADDDTNRVELSKLCLSTRSDLRSARPFCGTLLAQYTQALSNLDSILAILIIDPAIGPITPTPAEIETLYSLISAVAKQLAVLGRLLDDHARDLPAEPTDEAPL